VPPPRYLPRQDGLTHQRYTMAGMRTTNPMHVCLGLLGLGIPNNETEDMGVASVAANDHNNRRGTAPNSQPSSTGHRRDSGNHNYRTNICNGQLCSGSPN
jgi:hypothetical protein